MRLAAVKAVYRVSRRIMRLCPNQVIALFQNPEIALEDLPTADAVSWQPLHDRYVRQLQIRRLALLLFFALIATIASFVPGIFLIQKVLLWAAIVVFGFPFLLWPIVAVPRKGYVLRDKDVIYRSGVLFRSVTAVPFNRIQHVETSSTPFDRRFGTATLKLFTAGGSGGDLNIDGLPAPTAESLRVYILGKVGVSIEQS